MYKYRYVWNIFSKIKGNYSSYHAPTKEPKYSVPCALGFSLFTWLGFQHKLSAEDELIQTIKHCIVFIQRTEYEKAEQLLHIALRHAQQLRHELGITYVYDVMANLALERLQLDKAKQLFIAVTQRIMADGAKEDDVRVIHLSAKLARISHLKKEHQTAQIGFDWCLEKLFKVSDPSEATIKLLAMTEDWYGRLFLDCNKLEQGLKLMIDSLNHMRQVPDVEKEHIVIQLNDIATVYDDIGNTDECIQYLKEAIELGKSLDMEDIGAMYVNLGKAYFKKKLLDEARRNCGHGWKLGVQSKNEEIKKEAATCIKEINSMK